ncbi:MAG: hypothetical protein KF805_12745 [Phycisphaeraceae bacterium]|nr:hypothetical protein [Phycisphaeraceae bacterium]
MLSDIASFEQIALVELAGSGRSETVRGVFNGERRFMVNGEYAQLMEHALLGYPIGTGGGIFWTNADVWPNRPDATCRSVSITYTGRVGGTARDQITHSKAIVTAKYSNAFDGVSGQGDNEQVVAPTQDNIASCSVGAQMVGLSKKNIEWQTGGDPLPPDLSPSVTVLHRDVTIPITNSQKKPLTFDPFVGRVNSVLFLDSAAETVLYLGNDVQQRRLVVPAVPLPAISSAPPTKVIVWDYVHKFAIRSSSWQKFYGNPFVTNGAADSIVEAGTANVVLPYGAAVDLNQIFANPTP